MELKEKVFDSKGQEYSFQVAPAPFCAMYSSISTFLRAWRKTEMEQQV